MIPLHRLSMHQLDHRRWYQRSGNEGTTWAECQQGCGGFARGGRVCLACLDAEVRRRRAAEATALQASASRQASPVAPSQ